MSDVMFSTQPLAAASTLLDPTTNRPVWSGPNGEGGSATRTAVEQAAKNAGISTALIQTNVMPDGRVAYYVPGAFIQNGNRAALGLNTNPAYTSTAPGGTASAANPSPASAADSGTAASLLRQYNLDELLPFVDQIARGSLTWSQLLSQLYDPTTTPGKVVDRLYPALKQLRDKGLEPISIDQYQQLRTQYRQAFREIDAPTGFYDSNDDFDQYILGQKSPDELRAELGEWRTVADEAAADPANANHLSELHRLYGITPDSGAFLAYVINPERGVAAVKQQIAAAGVSASASRAGFGPLDRSEAEMLAARGVSDQQAQQGFTDLTHNKELLAPLPGEAGPGVGRADQLAAEFSGNADAQAAIERARGQHLAGFQGGGRTAAGRSGSTGLAPI